jgi:hypothetical protein
LEVFQPVLTVLCGSDQKQVLLKGRFDNPITGIISFPPCWDTNDGRRSEVGRCHA